MRYKYIYLQFPEDGYDDQTTWCQDKIHDDDVKYVLADNITDAAPELYEALKALFNDVVSTEIYDLDEQALLVAASEAINKAEGKS